MKTGFICNSGFNVVASATRDGRRLVAVVLGEPSVASRTDRAANLLENGFKRYFWKSVFGTTIDGLAMQASLSDGPDASAQRHLRRRPGQTERKRTAIKAKPKPRAPPTEGGRSLRPIATTTPFACAPTRR